MKFVIPFLIVLILDKITKLIFTNGNLASTELNHAISFEWLASSLSAAQVTLLVIVIAGSLAVGLCSVWQRYPVVAGLFWGGVVSNITDRLLVGAVVDWLTIPYVPIKNNLADIAISISVVVLAVLMVKETHESRSFT